MFRTGAIWKKNSILRTTRRATSAGHLEGPSPRPTSFFTQATAVISSRITWMPSSARGQPFGERIAHGTMTFAIGIGLTATQINPRAFTYGYERLRFPKPVYAGDTIRTTVTIGQKSDDPKRPGFGKVVEICETKKQNGSTVMYCEHILLVEKKDADSAE